MTLKFLLTPVIGAAMPVWVLSEAKRPISLLIWSLFVMGLGIAALRYALFIPHAKSPDLSRLYDIIFHLQGLSARAVIEGIAMWLVADKLLKAPIGLIRAVAFTAALTLPLLLRMIADMALSGAIELAICTLTEVWHLVALTFVLNRYTSLGLAKSLATATLVVLAVFISFDDVWALKKLLIWPL